MVVFRLPREDSTDYIKRLIGLPNETVRVHRGDIFIQAKDEEKDIQPFEIARKPPEKLRVMVDYNPMSYLVRAYRERLLSYRLPDLQELALLTAFALTAFFIGGLFFRHLKRGFADVL